MRLRLAALVSIAMAGTGIVVAPAAADPLPTISIADATFDEPTYPTTSNVAPFTVTLSAPSATDVTVDYELPGSDVGCCPNYRAVATSGTLRIPAGQLTAVIPVTILDDAWGQNGTIHMYLMNPTGATLAMSTYTTLWSYPNSTSAYMEKATGTILNHDRLGDFGCSATGAAESIYSYRPTTSRPYYGPTNSEVDAVAFSTPCTSRSHSTGGTTQTVPATAASPTITISVGPEDLSNDGFTPAAPDYRPTLGSYGDARASIASVTITTGLNTVVIHRLQAHVHQACVALGGETSSSADSIVGQVVVNGVALPTVPSSLDLGTIKLLFNRDQSTARSTVRTAVELIEGDVNPYDYPYSMNQGVDISLASAAMSTYGGSPCRD